MQQLCHKIVHNFVHHKTCQQANLHTPIRINAVMLQDKAIKFKLIKNKLMCKLLIMVSHYLNLLDF